MTGRHRRPRARHRLETRSLTVRTAGAVGATALGVSLAPGVAVADTTAPEMPAPTGPVATSDRSHQTRGERVVDAASEHFGKPYQWGGEGPITFDCSGLTKYVYREFGARLPHNSAAQYRVVDHVAKSDKRLGDLIFIYDADGIFHVGIYAGGDQMWAATKTGDVVRKQEIWTDSYVVGRP